MNFYKRYPGDYARDTFLLSLMEHGAYALLLDFYYSREKPLPNDMKALERVCRATTKKEKEAVASVVEKYFPVGEDGLRHNARANREFVRAATPGSTAARGRSGAESRWGKTDATQKRSERLAEARRKATHSKEEWLAMVEVCGNKCLKCGISADDFIGGTVCKDHIVPIYKGGSDGIENLQPMCRECNTGKGPDTTDHRPSDWRKRLAERLAKPLAKCLTQTPDSRLQTPEEESKSGYAASADDPRKQLFDLGKTILGANSGSLISKAIKQTSESHVGAVLGEMALRQMAEPRAYFAKATQPKQPRLVV